MKGFTLIEVIVSTAIMSVIILALLTACNAGQSAYSSSDKIMDVMQVIRHPVQSMMNEIRQSKPTDVVITNSGAKIQFVIPKTLNPVSYSQDISYYVNANNQLVREHPLGTTKILASNIDSINFSIAANRLQLNLQARARLKHQDLVLPVSEIITLRN